MKLHKFCIYDDSNPKTPVNSLIRARCDEFAYSCDTCPYLKSTLYAGGYPTGAELIVKVLKLEPE